MPVKQTLPRIPLPRNWNHHVKSAVLHTISLAHFSIVHARGMAAGHILRRKRLAEGRAGVQSTVGGDSGAATKTLLGN